MVEDNQTTFFGGGANSYNPKYECGYHAWHFFFDSFKAIIKISKELHDIKKDKKNNAHL